MDAPNRSGEVRGAGCFLQLSCGSAHPQATRGPDGLSKVVTFRDSRSCLASESREPGRSTSRARMVAQGRQRERVVRPQAGHNIFVLQYELSLALDHAPRAAGRQRAHFPACCWLLNRCCRPQPSCQCDNDEVGEAAASVESAQLRPELIRSCQSMPSRHAGIPGGSSQPLPWQSPTTSVQGIETAACRLIG